MDAQVPHLCYEVRGHLMGSVLPPCGFWERAWQWAPVPPEPSQWPSLSFHLFLGVAHISSLSTNNIPTPQFSDEQPRILGYCLLSVKFYILHILKMWRTQRDFDSRLCDHRSLFSISYVLTSPCISIVPSPVPECVLIVSVLSRHTPYVHIHCGPTCLF